MAIYELTGEAISRVDPSRFTSLEIRERDDLQRLLRESIDVIAEPDGASGRDGAPAGLYVIAEEFGNWEDSRRRIDLLCIDRDANLIVVELKRDERGGHMDLQAIRYAAMVSTMRFDQLVDAHAAYLLQRDEQETDAEQAILDFLQWDEPNEDDFAQDVRIILVSADFSRELTTAVLWLNDRQLDIRCVRMRPHDLDGRTLLDVQQIIPLPEAQDYIEQVGRKKRSERVARKFRWDGEWFVNCGEGPHRAWDDQRRYGYIAAGGAPKWSDQLKRLRIDDEVFVYLSGKGYVGWGVVKAAPVIESEFIVEAENKPLQQLPYHTERPPKERANPARADFCVAVEWKAALPADRAIKAQFRRGTVCKIHKGSLVEQLRREFRERLAETTAPGR